MNEFVVIHLVCANGPNYPGIFIIERDPRLLRRPPRVPSELVSKFPVLKQLCRQPVQLLPSHVPPLPADRRDPSACQGIDSSIRKASGLSRGPRNARAPGRIAGFEAARPFGLDSFLHEDNVRVKILDGEVESFLGVYLQARVIEIVVQWLRKWGTSGGANHTAAPRGSGSLGRI